MQTSSNKKARPSLSSSSLLQLPDDALFHIFSLCDARELFYAVPFLCKSIWQFLKKQSLTNEEIFQLANEERMHLQQQYKKLTNSLAIAVACCPESSQLEQLMMRFTVTAENKIWKLRVHAAVPSFNSGIATKDHLYCYKKIYFNLFPMKKPVYAAERMVAETLKKVENLPTATLWPIFKQDTEKIYGPEADKKIAQEKEQQASSNQMLDSFLHNQLHQYMMMQQQQQPIPMPLPPLPQPQPLPADPMPSLNPIPQVFPLSLNPQQQQQQQQFYPMSQPEPHFIPQATPQPLPSLQVAMQMQPDELIPFDHFQTFASSLLPAPISQPFNHMALPVPEASSTNETIIEPPPPPKPMDATNKLDKCIELHEQSFATNVENVAKHLEELAASLRATKELVVSCQAKQTHNWNSFEPKHGFKALEKIISFLRGTVVVHEQETTDPDPAPERGRCTWVYEANIQMISPVNSNSVELTIELNIAGYSIEGCIDETYDRTISVRMKLVDFTGKKIETGEIQNLWPAAIHLGLDMFCSDSAERGMLVHEMWKQVVDPVLRPHESSFEDQELEEYKGRAPPECSPSDCNYDAIMNAYRRNCEQLFFTEPRETRPNPTITTPPMMQEFTPLSVQQQQLQEALFPQFQSNYQLFQLQQPQQQQFLQPTPNYTPLHPSALPHPPSGIQQPIHTQQQQTQQLPLPSPFNEHR